MHKMPEEISKVLTKFLLLLHLTILNKYKLLDLAPNVMTELHKSTFLPSRRHGKLP